MLNGAAFACGYGAPRPRLASDSAMGFEGCPAGHSGLAKAGSGVAEGRGGCICAGWKGAITGVQRLFDGGGAWLHRRVRAGRVDEGQSRM
jgi:hypothetical protein